MTDFIFQHTLFSLIALAFLADLILGDPHSCLHPVALFGRTAAVVENFCRKYLGNTIFSGFCACSLLCFSVCFLTALFCLLGKRLAGSWGELVCAALCVYITIAPRSLIEHVNRIRQQLKSGNLPEAQHALSMIVSRKTDNLPEEQIVRGAIESLGENLIEAVYSAFFWAIAVFMLSAGSLLWAAVSAVFLRAVNTLDACWGYKDEKYLFFGRTAARTDDLLHWIP